MLVSLGKGPYPLGRFTIGRSLIVGRFPLADSSGLRISNMFDRESRLTITESVEESADSAVESVDSTSDSTADPMKIGLWVE